MTDNTGKENSTDEHSQSEEPQFDELSNAELDEVQGAGVFAKLNDVEGEALRVSDKSFKVEINGVRETSKTSYKAT